MCGSCLAVRAGRCAQVLLGFLGAFAMLPALAGSPPPLPNPDLTFYTGATVESIARLPDGSVVLSGEFTSINNTPRAGLALIRADGTLDPDWNPDPDGRVMTIVWDTSSNAIFVAGYFTQIGGQSRRGIAKLHSDGAGDADPEWNPSPAGFGGVSVLLTDGAGSLYAGGDFEGIGGQARLNIAKLSSFGEGNADAAWDPSADAPVYALVLDGQGRLYAGGHFDSIGGEPRGRIARLATGGSGAADPDWSPYANNDVERLASDGSTIYAAGAFFYIGGQSITHLARLSTSGQGDADPNFNPAPDGYVSSLVFAGALYVGGQFNNIGGRARRNLAKLSGGAADVNWNPSPNAIVRALAVDATDNAYVGGEFSWIGTELSLGYGMVSAAGTPLTTTVDTEYKIGRVDAIASQPDGGIIVGGAFHKVGLVRRPNLLRLNIDGTLDTSWNPAPNDEVITVASDADGAVYASGAFTYVGGGAHQHLVKLSGSGTGAADPSWNPSTDGTVYAYAFDGAGSIYVGGSFNTMSNQDRHSVAKIAAGGSGAVDPEWNPSATGVVYGMVLDHDTNSLFAQGAYTRIGGLDRVCLAKLSASGTGVADAQWDAQTNGAGGAMVLDGQGHLIVGGGWTMIGGVARSHIAKVSTMGTGVVDPEWNPAPDGSVGNIAWDGADGLYIGGPFLSAVGGEPRTGLAKISLSGTGVLDDAWQPTQNGQLASLVLDGRGAAYIGGAFSEVGGQPRALIAALPALASGADLSIAIDDGVRFVEDDGVLDYAITVHNAGPENALGARVQDTLPATLIGAEWTCTPLGGASCSPSGNGDIDDAVDLPNGATIVYELIATAQVGDRQPIENTATVTPSSGLGDGNPANNSATDIDKIGVFLDGFDGG